MTASDESLGEAFCKKADSLYARYFCLDESENTLPAALTLYGRALEHNPDCPAVFVGLAKTCLALGLYARAERNALLAMKRLQAQDGAFIKPERRLLHDALRMLGALSEHRIEWSHAASYYARALRWSGGSSARWGLFHALWRQADECSSAWTWISSKMRLKALGTLLLGTPSLLSEGLKGRNSFWKHLRFYSSPRTLWAIICDEIGETEAALTHYLALARRYPGMLRLILRIGDIYRDKGDVEEAQIWFRQALDRHPLCTEAMALLAGLREREEDYEGMAHWYQKLVALRAFDAHALCNLANAYFHGRHYTEALKYYEAAFNLALDSRWRASIAQGMANIQANYLQNIPAAIAYYEIAKALNPTDVENQLQLGLLYFQQDNYENAEIVYRQAAKVDPNNPRIYSNLGYLRWMAEDADMAVTYYKKAIALDPDYEIPFNNLGVIYLDMLGDVRQAHILFERAIEANPEYALAYYNLGRSCCFVGDRHRAARYFRQARELNNHSHELDNEELTARINQLFDPCELE